jgi:hypothetical protein
VTCETEILSGPRDAGGINVGTQRFGERTMMDGHGIP